MQKEKNKEERNILIVFWSLFIILNLIGYLMNIDILKTFLIKENGNDFHFASVFISLFVSIIYHIIYCIISKYNRK